MCVSVPFLKNNPAGARLYHLSSCDYIKIERLYSTKPEHFSDRAEKILLFWVEKILPMTIPLGASGLNFRAGLGPGPGLGQATRVFYSVKQLKTAFRARLGPNFFSQASRSLPTPVQ
jgi:hypothetical protein